MKYAQIALLMGPSVCLADPIYSDIPPEHDVIILGEVHDNLQHHISQAEVIAALQPAAVVFEMLSPAEASYIFRPADRAGIDIQTRVNWDTSGWPDYDLYAPVFDVLGDALVYGAEVDRASMGEVFATSASHVFEQQFASLYGPATAAYGLTLPLPADQQAAREALQQEAHCGTLPPEMLPGFVAAQRLRDTALAWATLQAIEQTQGLVIVITGNGHARTDWGVPAVLATVAPDLGTYSIGHIEGVGTDAPFDMIVATPILDRPDPCAVFEN